MQRNFDRRIEIAFPVLEPALQNHLKEILETQLADSVKSWWMQPDGRYLRAKTDGSNGLRSQERLYALAAAEEQRGGITSLGLPVAEHHLNPEQTFLNEGERGLRTKYTGVQE